MNFAMFVCSNPINVKMAEPIGPNFMTTHKTSGKSMDRQKCCPKKFNIYHFWKCTKNRKNLWKIEND